MSIKKSTREILAKNVTYLRHQKGWSQEELSEKSGRSISIISDIENANTSASVDCIDDIALALNSTTSDLTKDNGYKVTKKRVDSKY